MPTLAALKKKTLKQQKLRNNEYYDMQNIFDRLHEESIKGYVFKDLVSLVLMEENILLAYRNLKKNRGSSTPGVDRKTIADISTMTDEAIIKAVRNKLKWYTPQAVRRVNIPKGNGKTRPLGIPTIMDRLVQQSILQVLEPICEAKFHDRSNGFRPNRGAENALAQFEKLVQVSNMHIVIDIDIKGFFDNVSHGKLLKQMWAMGIHEKKLLSIISAMLKAEVAGIGFPEQGTPQGGIISPLLSNIVLNELDWWIASQWEEIPTRRKYYSKVHVNGTKDKGKKYRALRGSNLKECYIVRYADDFKIVCKKHGDAVKLFAATKLWLKERLGLETSPEKSKIINLKHQYSDFLGFRIKLHKKGKDKKTKDLRDKYVVVSHVSSKALAKIKATAKEHLKGIQFSKDQFTEYQRINYYNSYVMGIHNYYSMATSVNADFQPLAYEIKASIRARLQKRVKRRCKKSLSGKYVKERYGKSKEVRYINGNLLVPIGYVQHHPPLHKKKVTNKYTVEGRKEIHKSLERVDISMVHTIMRNPVKSETVEYNDNRLSLFVAQKGKCAVTSNALSPEDVHCHHIKPKTVGGDDGYKNLIIVCEPIHRAIHATDLNTIMAILEKYRFTKKQKDRFNKLRSQAQCEVFDFSVLDNKAEIHTIS